MIVKLVQKILGDCCCLILTLQVGKAKNYGNDIQVKIDAKEQESNFAVQRMISVTSTTAQTKKIDHHYHVTSWKDWQLPTDDSRSNLASLIEKVAAFVTTNF